MYMPDNYLKVREDAKKRETQWTLKQRIFNYIFMIVLVAGLAVYPILGIKYFISFIFILIIVSLIVKKYVHEK